MELCVLQVNCCEPTIWLERHEEAARPRNANSRPVVREGGAGSEEAERCSLPNHAWDGPETEESALFLKMWVEQKQTL